MFRSGVQIEKFTPGCPGVSRLRSFVVLPVCLPGCHLQGNLLANEVDHDLAKANANAVIDVTLVAAEAVLADQPAISGNTFHVGHLTREMRINVSEESPVVHVLHPVIGGEICHVAILGAVKPLHDSTSEPLDQEKGIMLLTLFLYVHHVPPFEVLPRLQHAERRWNTII